MKFVKLLVVVLVCLFVTAAPALAQERSQVTNYPGQYVLTGAGIGAGIGIALTILGAGLGFGKIGSAALESMARQPEVAPRVQTAMLIIAALLEGATFFALIVCLLLAQQAGMGL